MKPWFSGTFFVVLPAIEKMNLLKNAKNSQFWRVIKKRPKTCGQTVLPDRSINSTNMGGKRQIFNPTFREICKQCDYSKSPKQCYQRSQY